MAPSVSPTEASIDVSAIVIARNEEGNIVDCLRAVFRALDAAKDRNLFHTYEVVLVDSASTDRTVDLASAFPVVIARLRREWPLSASAGKATGVRLARGRFFLFVDGDYVMDPGWIPVAWGLLQHPEVAGVCGWDLEQVTGDSVLARRMAQMNPVDMPELEEVDSIAAGLVKRPAYEMVGGLHPYLRGAEDRDLGLRLLRAGWKILKTRHAMGLHRWLPPGQRLTYLVYYRSVAVWSLGDGQACRARWRDRPLRRAFLRRYGTLRYLIQDFQLDVTVILALVNLSALRGGWSVAIAFLADLGALIAFHAWARSKNCTWREALFEFQGAFYGPYRQVLFALGLLRPSPPPETYPKDVEIVQEGQGPTRAR